jgi:hypothetical protein
VQATGFSCKRYKVCYIVEALNSSFAGNDENSGTYDATLFEAAVNGFFIEEGIGWQLVNGRRITRGPETF